MNIRLSSATSWEMEDLCILVVVELEKGLDEEVREAKEHLLHHLLKTRCYLASEDHLQSKRLHSIMA